MIEQEIPSYTVCQFQTCPIRYYWDFRKRVRLSGEEGQGTGNLVEDLKQRLNLTGISCKVDIMMCFGRCNDGPNIKTRSGTFISRFYWENIDQLIKEDK